MTTFEQYIEQYEKMIHKIINRYSVVGERLGYTYDELYQSALIGLWKGIESYDPTEHDHSMFTHLYNYVKWAIMKSLKRDKLKDKFGIISIDAPIGEDIEDGTLADTIKDDTVDIEYRCLYDAEVLEYHQEFTELLGEPIRASIIIDHALYYLNGRELSNLYQIDYKRVRTILDRDKYKLSRKSILLKTAYQMSLDDRKRYNKDRSYKASAEEILVTEEYLEELRRKYLG